jgi:hypothetical protein
MICIPTGREPKQLRNKDYPRHRVYYALPAITFNKHNPSLPSHCPPTHSSPTPPHEPQSQSAPSRLPLSFPAHFPFPFPSSVFSSQLEQRLHPLHRPLRISPIPSRRRRIRAITPSRRRVGAIPTSRGSRPWGAARARLARARMGRRVRRILIVGGF